MPIQGRRAERRAAPAPATGGQSSVIYRQTSQLDMGPGAPLVLTAVLTLGLAGSAPHNEAHVRMYLQRWLRRRARTSHGMRAT